MGECYDDDSILRYTLDYRVWETTQENASCPALEWGSETRILPNEIERPSQVGIKRLAQPFRLTLVMLQRLDALFQRSTEKSESHLRSNVARIRRRASSYEISSITPASQSASRFLTSVAPEGPPPRTPVPGEHAVAPALGVPSGRRSNLVALQL